MTTIYIIDNDPNRHWQCASLINKLNESAAGSFCAAFQDALDSDPNSASHQRNARTSITADKIWEWVSQAPKESVFLIDFKLHDVKGAQQDYDASSLRNKLDLWSNESAKAAAKEKIGSIVNYALNDYYCAVFACAVLTARGIPVVVISTADGQVQIEALIKDWKMGHARSVSASEAWKEWMTSIQELRRHPDLLINRLLATYFAQISRIESTAWDHAWCEDHGLEPAQQMLSNHEFDEALSPNSKTKEIKALFMRANGAWKCRSPENVVSAETLKSALKVLDIDAEVETAVFEFPLSPGIAFLISLKELLLASRDKGPPKRIHFFAVPNDAVSKDSARMFGLRIEFSPRDDNPDGLNAVLRLLEKLRTAESDAAGPAGGLAEGIWNLGHCRSKQTRTFSEPWAEMFAEGAAHWVAWPSFDRNSVIFQWAEQ